MQHRATRGAAFFAAISLLLLAAPGGCGHASFDFQTDKANMETGGTGGSPPGPGSGGVPLAPTGGVSGFQTGGASGYGEGAAGGEGGSFGCMGPGCPLRPCCDDVDIYCAPFEGWCIYCSGQDECGPGFACDPLSDQCLPECTDHFSCPKHAPFCDPARGVCTQCSMDVHCRPGSTCLQGFCVPCDDCH